MSAPWSPTGETQPRTTSSIRSGSRSVLRSRVACMRPTTRSTGLVECSEPLALPAPRGCARRRTRGRRCSWQGQLLCCRFLLQGQDHTSRYGRLPVVQRRSRNDYFEAGLGLLAEGGAKAVTIDNLCARLGTTKGSFYHHFESGPAFMGALLAYWEGEYSQHLAEAALAVDDPVERLETHQADHRGSQSRGGERHPGPGPHRPGRRGGPAPDRHRPRQDDGPHTPGGRGRPRRGPPPGRRRTGGADRPAAATPPIDRARVREVVGETPGLAETRIALASAAR